jgi:hypothetical protein
MAALALIGFATLMFFAGSSTYISLREESYNKDGLLKTI